MATKLSVNDLEEAAHETLNRIMNDHPEEIRAEIYTRFVDEIPTDAMIPFLELQMIISEALWDTLYV